jgi:hypothetical protein
VNLWVGGWRLDLEISALCRRVAVRDILRDLRREPAENRMTLAETRSTQSRGGMD